MKSVPILLIEDNAADATFVKVQLHKLNTAYTLDICDCISKAEKIIQGKAFSLIIIDLCLPDNKGIGTLKYFVQKSKVPVIVYTGINDSLVKEHALLAGISDYLVKGQTSSEDLQNSINKCLLKPKVKDY